MDIARASSKRDIRCESSTALAGDVVLMKYITEKVFAKLLRHWLVELVSPGFEPTRVISPEC